uniref:ATP synthase CF0 B' chain subunit II n=5 Tax=Laminariales TaxID=2886 RepID=A0A0S0GJT6_COSCS|nr:ATP synthase CF0 B' chain subunit II [Costaria costata]YP_010206455.1 AtpG [Alaria crispa]YP_010206596.1 AtpG [Alaria marginata]YP_010206737.1 AtpG [Alaria esculenta]YP_010206878.1 AtpG [Alaria crassifolia]YP_010207019.1 AtpG [Alaria praelonga]YP_011006084.1 ATP synthase CF0, subunit B' [Dictyoneurum californicum]QWK42499.1 CF0 subunit II [Lessoniopsis littoralis]UAX21898.1 AtpG [Alaria sp. PI001]UAX22039.1 AtpG [Alaria sp. PI20]UAX22462.1 AtpG [Alaria sp. TTB000023]UAX22603.1 AtpG [A
MFYNYNSILIIGTEKTGGLFDFDGTLPIIALQFVIFMFILNFILYTPLLDTIDERNLYIKKSLDEATSVLTKSNQLNVKYEAKTSKARKAAKLDLLTYQKLYKDILEEKMKSSQLFIDKFLIETTENFENNKDSILTSFDNEIDSLSSQIMTKLLT